MKKIESLALLPVHRSADQADVLAGTLRAAGLAPLQGVACHALVHEAVRQAPQAVVVAAPTDFAPWPDLQCLLDGQPLPVLLWWPEGAPTDPAWMDAALAAGVSAWRVGADLPDWPGAVAEALARHAQVRALRQQLDKAQAQMDERKWVDRAKGLLMRGGTLNEDEAFRMLRSASMQANLRLGEVSRSVIETALLAEGVNRAGQLRMLSQRYVKALALQVAPGAWQDGAAVQAATAARIEANLAFLGAQPLQTDAPGQLQAVRDAWQALQRHRQPDIDHLPQADAAALALLQGAEALTAALEAAGGRQRVQVVNLCGRQRMLSQRLAKEALLAALLPPAWAQASAEHAKACAQEFELAHAQLVQAPLSTPAIREGLAQVRGLWLRLTRAALPAAAETGASPQALARTSEDLLDALERLTERFESSLQLLLA
ncbi:response regulator with putative antiterminator output domain [Burkholderiales bacterium JOSHI_001]|nr:response regulator with putative antiterminator output domain [Burkholderiales bacterium JOSHI_001]